ncbi:MAG: PQQ-dependent sugar dehydrogenase [Sphingobacteriales bacterium]
MKNNFFWIAAFALFIFSCRSNKSETEEIKSTAETITLPPGFHSTVLADTVGSARHIAVSENGVVYVKLDNHNPGRSILRLIDTNKDGVADNITGFADYSGTGIAIGNGYLYASSNDKIYRYKLENGEVPSSPKEELIVQGLINHGQHAAKSLAIDDAGNIYVNIGAPSNGCQVEDRTPGSPGMSPCPILDSAGGIWQFKTDKLNQTYGDGLRYASGIRNMVALSWNKPANDLYGVQHGKDDLDRLYPDLYTQEQRVELPAEEMFLITKGSDFGWPYCYYDHLQKKKVQSPEYGGDGKKTTGCNDKGQPIYAFPAHWAPNALLFYTGSQFPEKYRNGAFIAFHGSWNRAPKEQAGYNVVFLPFKDGKPSGEYEVFADNFAGKEKTPNDAAHRPCGLAQGPDGSLYVSDDLHGRIWKITYKGK